jgi:hypothetical protein
MANAVVDRTGAPAYTWLLCLMYVCFILNFTVSAALNGGIPIQRATASTNDISSLLRFHFWEKVHYKLGDAKLDDATFPSESRQKLGRFVGIAEHVGHFMTFKMLTDDTNKLIYRSNVRSALDPNAKNLRLDPLRGEITPILASGHNPNDNPNDGENKEYHQHKLMPRFEPSDLIGKTFLMKPQEDGQRFRARIVRAF